MEEKYPIEITEKREVKRITVKQSITDFLDAFNVERGLIFTLKLLFAKPGKLVRFYLTNGRFKIVNAFRLLIITTTVSLIILNYTSSFQELYSVHGDNPEETEELSNLMGKLFTDWYNLVLWAAIPCFALFGFLFLKKYERFNYAEHLVIQSFYFSASNIFYIVCSPLGFLFGIKIVFIVSTILSTFYYIFLYWDIYKVRKFGFFLRTIFAVFFGMILYFLLLAIGMIGFFAAKMNS